MLLTNESGLLISWATPATIWPSPASFSDWTSWLWACFEVLVGLALGLGHLLEQEVLGLELLLGPLPLGDVPEDPLDADDPAARRRRAGS